MVSKGTGSSYARELVGTITSCLNALALSTPDTDSEDDTDAADLAALIADPTAYLDDDVADDVSASEEEEVPSLPDEMPADHVDLVHMSVPAPVAPPAPPATTSATPKTRPTHLPDWAQGYLNFRGLVPLSPAHFYGTAAFNGSITDVLMDTGGSRTMMDITSARKMGLQIQLTDKEIHYGSWSGPGDKPQYYVGRVPGPILVRFDAAVVIPLAEIKLIETSEPLIIVGSDFMAPPSSTRGWRFKDIGYDDHDVGTVRFRKGRRCRPIQLLAWPTVRPEMSPPRPYVAPPALKPKAKPTAATKPTPAVTASLPKAPKPTSISTSTPSTRSAALLALIRQNRGQHL